MFFFCNTKKQIQNSSEEKWKKFILMHAIIHHSLNVSFLLSNVNVLWRHFFSVAAIATQIMFREHKRAIVVNFGNSGLGFKFKLWQILSVITHFIFHTKFWLLSFFLHFFFQRDIIKHNIGSENLNLCHETTRNSYFWISLLKSYRNCMLPRYELIFRKFTKMMSPKKRESNESHENICTTTI